MAPHSSTLAWKIPWMEEPGRLQSIGSQRVGHDWATSLSLFIVMHWRGKTATHSSVLAWRILRTAEDGRAWWAAVYGVAESDTTEATQKQQHTSYSIDRMSFGQKYGELKNWNGLIGSTFSNKIFPICHPVTLPTSFWFFMTPLPFQKIIPKSSLVYLILTCVYFFFLPYSWFCTVLWNLVVHFVISTLF